MIIQNVAPGPPIEMAIATPAMLPRPTVPETAVARAWKCETSPASLGSEYLPFTRSIACLNPRTLRNPSQIVKKIAALISQRTTRRIVYSSLAVGP